eukprot:Lithocolla_globosa_v1_NODE_752_length_3331_cov_1184.225275.p1 type:complete len:350 gc:universal NODE_752_length_3331_cov_1184.225275:1932-883(-)
MKDKSINWDKLIALYYDPESGFISANALHKKSKGEYTLKEIKQFLESQETEQIHKIKKVKKNLYFPIMGVTGTYQADLTFFRKYKKSNGGHEYILTCIKINTRKAYAKALKTKSEKEVNTKFEEIINEAGDMTSVSTDAGSEFQKSFTKLLKKYNITHYITNAGDKNKQGKVERFNRTIRERIEKYLTSRNTNKWVDVLDSLVRNYNNTEHSSIGIEPNNVTNRIEKVIQDADREKVDYIDKNIPSYEVGDEVRLKKKRGTFDKRSGQQYEEGTYIITKVNAFSYRLKGVNRTIKPYEIIKVNDVSTFQKKDNVFDRKKEVKELKINNELKREGIDEKNLINIKRGRGK